jgi:predicted O-linked N-acetylglucosamine transferase (SPINDLY family)
MTLQSKFREGLALHQQGQWAQAQQIYQQILKVQPRHADTLHLLGMLARQTGNPAQAVHWIEKSLKISPDNAAAYSNLGNALSDLKRYPEAIDSYDKAIALQPNQAEAWSNRGVALNALEQHQAAIDSYDRAIALKADFAKAWCNRGIALNALKRHQEAIGNYEQAIALEPNYVEALFNRGNALNELKKYQEAIDSFNQALAFQPDHADAWCNRGNALLKLKQHQAAIDSCDRAIALKPALAQAWFSRGNALLELKLYQEAIDGYDRALATQPDNTEAWYRRGVAMYNTKQYRAAVDSFDQAIAIRADHADAYFNRANALNELKQYQAAIDSFDQAIALNPDFAPAYNNRGCVLISLKQHQLAVDSYDQALALQSDNASAWCNRGVALFDLKQHQAAIDSYDRAIALQPDHPLLHGPRLHIKKQICDWRDAEHEVAELLARIDQNEKVSTSLSALALTASLRLQRKAAQTWVNDKFPENFELGQIPKRGKRDKIRLGYFSMDFLNHPVSYLTAELFETHDRDKFEVYAFSFGIDTKDDMRTRLEAGFDKFIDVWSRSEREIAELARQMEIDIAIDLAGLTGDSRTGIFARRAAPLQVNYLGYPGTMGASYMDYLIADPQLVPEEAQAHYAEHIVYLPSFQANDSQRAISSKVFGREELGLPQTGFVFCNFNSLYKITPGTFDGWMRILKQVDGSVLFLLADNELAAINLTREASQRGVDAGRLVFGKRLATTEYLARYRAADLFLDTFPFNAGTTASDALWAGLPLLTLTGEAFASRMAASLLSAIELPELITTTQEEYEALAVALALNPERLQAIRQKLARNRLSTALFDTPRFTRHLEDAYTQMLELYHADLPPEHIYVKPFHLDTGQVQSRFKEALALHQQGLLTQAKPIYQEILQVQPKHADALHFLGMLARQNGDLTAALDLIGKSIEIRPDNAAAWSNLGNALSDLKRYPEAINSYDKAISLQPNHADAYSNRGVALNHLQQYQAAIDSYDKAIALKPDFAQPWCSRGIALSALERHQNAIESFDRAIALESEHAQAWCDRGNAQSALKEHRQAVDSYDRAIALNPEYADAWCNRGNALHALRQYQAAIDSYQHAMAIAPDQAEAYCNCGNTLRESKQQLQAIEYYDKAIALKADYAEAYSNRGAALNDLLQHEQALISYDRAIALQPDLAKAYSNRGNAFNALKQRLQAIENYEKALALQPDQDYVPGTLLHTRMHVCDWSNAASRISELLARLDRNERIAQSFPVLSLTSSAALQRKAAEIWVNDKHAVNLELGSIPKRGKKEKIRLGYFSMDFRNHPVSFLTAELFETHDRERFEVYAFSYGPDTQDEMRKRLELAFDKFVDVKDKSERDIAALARQLEIDIAVDLAGFTGSSRSGLFAWRAAPVQINYLGYPGTMGASYMDYLIADPQLIPEEAKPHYCEKIVYLPDSYMVNDRQRAISDRVFSREELGLPPTGFVFCCFNNAYKITPGTFDGWMRILRQVDGSVLFLLADNELAATNLRKEACLRGMDADRLVFGKRLPAPEYLARYRVADLFLDTFPFNAGTTGSDALWAGLPVLTRTGEAFASRMASSLLSAIELPELITTTQEAYEALAVQLATNPERMQAIRQKLARHRLSTALFDTPRFTRHLEDAYTQMLERYHADLPPAHIHVAQAGVQG